jgi:GH24 family phage-related lysozyme (muramidase)
MLSASRPRVDRLFRQLAPKTLKVFDKKQSQSDKETTNELLRDTRAQIEGFIRANKRPPNDREATDIINNVFDRLFKTRVESGEDAFFSRIFGEGVSATNVIQAMKSFSPSQRAAARIDIEDAPPQVVQRVRELFKQSGIKEPTELQIENYLGAWAFGQRDRMRKLLGRQPRISGVRRKPSQRLSGETGANRGATAQELLTAAKAIKPQVGEAAEFVRKNEGGAVLNRHLVQGIPHIGVGFNLTRGDAEAKLKAAGVKDVKAVMSGKKNITKVQAEKLFEITLNEAQEEVSGAVSNFNSLSESRRIALVDVVFNMGLTNFKRIKGLVKAIEGGDFEKAAKLLEGTKGYINKVPKSRTSTVLRMLRSG